MVHALKLTHSLIKPGGWLINVHDCPIPHLIEVHPPEAAYKVGWLSVGHLQSFQIEFSSSPKSLRERQDNRPE